ncbi:ABC transporter permease [Cohnella thermotolerans]|uniref:ABC transporter permease n=1 Tax=Cohnella thermotolerans TaxID=329858 RepID=UPI00040884D0|nr:ABC-2 transporter permease [Cohnella thermotolerans]
MRVRALWSREYAQARLFVWAVPIVHFLAFGLLRMNKWLFVEPDVADVRLHAVEISSQPVLQAYEYGGFETTARLWLLLALFVLALVQIGTERKNGTQELLFALPYSRRQIFLHKWLFGLALLTGTLVANTIVDMLVVLWSPIAPYFSFAYHMAEMGYSWLALAAIYSLVLFIGTITGTVASQTILSLLTFIVPMGFISLVTNSLEVQGVRLQRPLDGDVGMPAWYDRLQDGLNLITYVTIPFDRLSWEKAAALFVLLLLSFVCGVLAYERNRTENNGKIMIFGGWEIVLRVGFVLCFSMIAGLFVSALVEFDEQIGYDIGLLVGFVLSALVIRKLTGMRFKF